MGSSSGKSLREIAVLPRARALAPDLNASPLSHSVPVHTDISLEEAVAPTVVGRPLLLPSLETLATSDEEEIRPMEGEQAFTSEPKECTSCPVIPGTMTPASAPTPFPS